MFYFQMLGFDECPNKWLIFRQS